MNKNLVKYPIRFGTLLLAGAALVACKKEEFTEKDAWNLENQRLTRLAQLKKTSDSLARVEREGMLKWHRSLDSLDRINAGGRVYYTVIPVNANEAVSGTGGPTGGGRVEEAITAAKVTITQFGRNLDATGSTNGVFTFSDLRSGEVTVNISAPNFTQVNYVANLTPDGGIPNNGVVNVGNVVPLFELPGTGANAAAKFSVIRGQAWFEGDLTDATVTPVGSPEERVTPTILGTNTNLVTANIDLSRNDGSATGLPYFHQRFILESNGERNNSFGVNVNSGAIQRFSYSKAVSYGQVDATGAYSLLVPASASGLPIRLNYSEFAFNRTYFNDRGITVTNERFLYGPNVVPTPIPTPTVATPTLLVRAFDQAATGTAVFSPQATGTQPDTFTGGTAGTLVLDAAELNFDRSGFYATAPTVTVTAAAGTGATFRANLSGTAADRANTAALYKGTNTAPFTDATVNANEFNASFRTIGSIEITAGGSGYTAANPYTLNFTRTDLVRNAGFGGQAANTGNAGGYLGLSTTTPIQVTDGGAGFIFNPALTVTSPGTFTNFLPTVVFAETDQVASANPDRGYNNLLPPVLNATARVFVDRSRSTEYTADFRGITGSTGAGGVGAVQEVRLLTSGQYPSGSLPFVNFSFGESVNTPGFLANAAPAVGGKNLFISGGAGLVKFNAGGAATNISTAEAERIFSVTAGDVTAFTPTNVTFTNGWGSRYTFVPTIQITPNTAAEAAMGAAVASAMRSTPVEVTVNSNPASAGFGRIVGIRLLQATIAGLNSGADNNDFLAAAPFAVGVTTIGLQVNPQRANNTLAAIGGGAAGRTVATGSALNTYSYSVTAQSASEATNLAAAMGGAKSNTTSLNLTTAEYLAGNNMLVVFDAPNNLTVTGRAHAWGVPVFVSDNAGTVGNVLAGARIIDGGSGYTAPTNGTPNFTSNIRATLVPNPWYRTNVPVTGVAMPSNVTAALGGGITTNQDIVGFLNHPAMTAQATANRPAPSITRARLVINIGATTGSGYSRAPRFVISGGNLNLIEYNAAAPIQGGESTSPGGVITLNSRIDSEGRITQVGNGTTVGPFTANPTTGGVIQRTLANSVVPANSNSTADIRNEFVFDVNRAPAYRNAGGATGNVTLNMSVVEELSVNLTRSLNNAVATGTGVGARVVVGQNATTPTGAVLAVRFNDGVNTILPVALATDARSPQVDIQVGTGVPAVVPALGYDSPLATAPFSTTVVGGSGTGATVQAWVTVDPNVAQHRRITAITVTNGGSGYGFVRTNTWWRANGGGPADPRNDNSSAGQAFAILGGFENGAYNGGGQNQSNAAFDAYPGLTYVRDVHYGTGRRID
jgi:hypothetical protein